MSNENLAPTIGPSPLNEDVVQELSLHDGLITSRLDLLEADIENATKTIADNPGVYSPTNPPEGLSYFWGDSTLIKTFRSESDFNPTLISRYVTLHRQVAAVERQLGHVSPPDRTLKIIERFEPSMLQSALTQEAADGPIHRLIVDCLPEERDESSAPLSVLVPSLQALLDVPRAIDLLTPEDTDPLRAYVRDRFLGAEGIGALMSSEQTMGNLPRSMTSEDLRVWMRDVVQVATGLTDPEAADEYVYAASNTPDAKDRVAKISSIIEKVTTIGPEALGELRPWIKSTLPDLSMAQIERTARIFSGDKAEIERLQKRDLQVVFINKMGDDGSLDKIPETLEDDRTVFIEIESFQDLYRDMIGLHQRGLAPSRVILAYHGFSGVIPLTAKPPITATAKTKGTVSNHTPTYIAMNNERIINEHGYAMYDMRGLGRMIDEYMQPSRGKDDPATSLGYKELLLDGCLSAKERPIKDYDPDTKTIIETTETSSAASHIAADLSRQNLQSKVVIMGAEESIKTIKTPGGVEFQTVNGDLVNVSSFTIEGDTVRSKQLAGVPLHPR